MPSRSPLSFATGTVIAVGLVLTCLNLSRLHLAGTSSSSLQLDYELRALEHMVPLVRPLVETTSSASVPDVLQLSRGLPAVDPSSNITTALCCKALFGEIDLWRVVLWVAYYRLLGFDHIFLFHQDIVANYSGFEVLQSLPYVTLTPVEGNIIEFKQKSQKLNRTVTIPYWRFVGKDSQKSLQNQCLRNYTKDYDWVMFADIDEYLSFSEEMGIKDFITEYSEDNISLGFGKYMYTLTARVDQVDSGFGLDMYAFTPGVYCKKELSESDESRKECGGFYGSTKLIVRPKHFANGIHGVHGPRHPNKNNREIQINTDIARFFEYPFMHQSVDASLFEIGEDFSVSSGSSLRMKYFDEAYAPNANGTWTVRYDDTPHKWYTYVASRGMMNTSKKSSDRSRMGAATF
jgi:hypothetical protein